MKLSEAFPSNFLKADDLGGRDITVEIEEATFEEIGQGRDKESKIMLAFKGKDKKLICNKTNANTISKLVGSDDTDDWVGHRITLTAREVDYQGEPMLAIRVSIKKPASAQAAAAGKKAPPAEEQHEPEDQGGEPDPDIPF